MDNILEFITERGIEGQARFNKIIQCTYDPDSDTTFLGVEPSSMYVCSGREVYELYHAMRKRQSAKENR